MTTFILHSKKAINAENLSESQNKSVIAKHYHGENVERYYVRVSNGSVIDPFKTSLAELKQTDVKFVEVTAENYDLYLKAVNGKTRTSFSSIGRLVNA